MQYDTRAAGANRMADGYTSAIDIQTLFIYGIEGTVQFQFFLAEMFILPGAQARLYLGGESFVDVIMVAPKGSGTSLRRNFLSGAGINASFAVEQDATGRAEQRCIALGIAIGSGYLFPTTFRNEVYSDLTGERGVLMGALAGIMEAQYDTLRQHGHSPSEAFNETVEELTESLIRLVGENGMDWMFANCSATAQRGALDWKPKFKKAVMPVFKELYKRVASGAETARVLRACGKRDYQEQLTKELDAIGNSEMWQAGKATRALRPKEAAKKISKATKGVAGRKSN